MMTTSEIKTAIQAAAIQKGIDPSLALAVAQTESSFNPNATSAKGAAGLFQLMPRTASYYGVTDPYDPAQSIDAGTSMLADLNRQYRGDTAQILAAYNWGSGNLASGAPMPAETTNYIARVLSLFSPAAAGAWPTWPASSGSDTTADPYTVDTWEDPAAAPTPNYAPLIGLALGLAALVFIAD